MKVPITNDNFIGLVSPLHLNHRRPHVDGGDHVQALPLIGAQVKPLWLICCFLVTVDGIGPALPTDLRILLVVPVHSVFCGFSGSPMGAGVVRLPAVLGKIKPPR